MKFKPTHHLHPAPQLAKWAFLVLLWVGLLPCAVFAQEKMILNPTNLMELSVQNSKMLKISEAKVMTAKARLAQSKDKSLPNVSASGAYYRFVKPDISLSQGLKNALGGNKSSGGGSGSGPSSIPQATQATLIQASASENLFSGFKTKYTIAADQYLVRAAELQSEEKKEEVIFNALSALYNLYKLKGNQNILNQDLTEQNRRVQDFQNLEKNGLLTRNDLLKAEVAANNIKLNILEVANARAIAEYNLKIMLNIPESTVIDIDTTHLFFNKSLQSREELAQYALDHRPDLQAGAEQNKGYQSLIKVSKSEFYPSINLNGGFIDAFVPGLLTIKNVFDASIGIRYNLTNLFTQKHQIQEAQANLSLSQYTYHGLEDQIRIGVNQDYLNYQEAVQKIELQQSIVDQATENYKILKNKYANSLATLTDLLEGEISLLQARLNQSNNRADAQIAYFNLLKSSGIKLSKDSLN